MQGQRSAIGSLPDSTNIDYGSLPNGVDINEQILWANPGNQGDVYTGSAGVEGQTVRWSFGELSSVNMENHVNHEQMTQSGWPPSINGSASGGLRLEGQRYEPADLIPQGGVDLNLCSNQIVAGHEFVRSSDSGSASQNLSITEGQYRRIGHGRDNPSSSKSLGFENTLITSTSNSSHLFASSSGSAGFLSEEDDGRPGCSLDGRRLSCKRKTLEGNGVQPSSSEGILQRIEGDMWHVVPPNYNAGSNIHVSATPESSSSISPPLQVNPRLGVDLSGGDSAASFRASNAHGSSHSSHRTYHFRMNQSDQQDSMPSNSFLPVPTAGGGRRPDIPLVHPPFRIVNPPLDLMSPIPPNNSVPQSRPVMVGVPALRRNMQPVRWNGGANIRPGSSSTSAITGERDTILPEHSNPRNAPRSTGNAGISRTVAPNSGTGSSLRSQNSSGLSWASNRQPPSQYSRRLSEYVRRSLMSTVASENAGQIGNNNQHHSGPATSQESILPPVAGNMHSQSRSSSASRLERQGDVVGLAYSLRALAAAGEGRSRLVSEIRNVLDIMRRGEGLRFEDVMILDQSVFSGMADIHDQHRDMRLDVDNMSYEELLALEDRIGNVCTGLSEETISKCMKQRRFIHTINSDQMIVAEACCICQETYNDGENLGILDCGHDFHSNCIKQWLAQKNLCPICKTTALDA